MQDVNKSAAPRISEAEVRQVTTVKCDIVGSTRIKRGLDMDGQLAFKRGLEAAINAAASRHGGFVERFEGDGALVFFGYPNAREDAAESAVRLGLDIVDSIRSARFIEGVQLQIRVGIASGPVAIEKQVTAQAGEALAGIIIDVAERLRAHAEPDSVVIADATKRLAAGFFEYVDLGKLQVKGFEEGVQAWRVLRESDVVSRFEAQRYGSRDDIIGRDAALALLSQAWSEALNGNGRAVCLVGDAGIGKSRLAKSALENAVRDGAAVLKIDCMPSTSNTPLFAVGVLFRRIADIAAATSSGEKNERARKLLAKYLPPGEIDSALGYLAPLFGLEGAVLANQTPDQVRDQTIATVVGMFRALAAQGPLAILCEDLHWADDTTARVVQKVADEIGGLRALMMVTARPDAEHLPNLPPAATISLQPLDAANAADLVRSVAKGAVLQADVVQSIVARCEGVPLLLEEVTRSVVEASAGVEDIRVDATPRGTVPLALKLVVESRLGRWPAFEPVVQAASVLGRDFSVRVLEQLLPSAQLAHVDEALALFARNGLFVPRDPAGGDRARFKHGMICEAVHEMLIGEDRRRLHSDAADILGARYAGSQDASPDVIAEHLHLARRFIESIKTRLAASADTAARGAYVETEGHCNAALALIDEVKDTAQKRELQFKLLVQLGVALTGEHGYASTRVEQAYRRAQVVCGEGAEAEMLYPIIRGLATLNLVRGKLAAAYDLSMQGLNLAQRSGRAEFRIDAMSVHCYTTLYYGRLADCREWIDRCIALYRAEHGEALTYPVPQDAGTAVLALLPTVAWLLGDAHGAEEAITEGLQHVERLNRDFDKALMHAWIAGTRYTQRRYGEAEQHALRAAAISQQHGYREWYGVGALMTLLSQAAQHGSAAAVAQATEICQAFAKEGVGLNASYYLWGLANGHARAGNAHAASAVLAQAFLSAEASQESRMNAELLLLQADLAEDSSRALELLTRALQIADEQGAVATSLRAAAAIIVRKAIDATAMNDARQTLDTLDGRVALPAHRDWMRHRLQALRDLIGEQPATQARA